MFDYSQAVLQPGKTIEVRFDNLPGSPVAQVEHLGETNASYLDDQIAQANAKLVGFASGTKRKQLSRKALDETRAKRREIVAKHAVRHLEARHKDGTPATDADIAQWVTALPPDIFDTLWDVANDAERYRDSPASDPKDLAEK